MKSFCKVLFFVCWFRLFTAWLVVFVFVFAGFAGFLLVFAGFGFLGVFFVLVGFGGFGSLVLVVLGGAWRNAWDERGTVPLFGKNIRDRRGGRLLDGEAAEYRWKKSTFVFSTRVP